MGQNKRYFWLKLFDDFFTSKRIKRLRKLAGGDTYTIIYLKMQLKALRTDGYLYFDGVMNDFAEELALDIDEEPEDVKVTIQYLLSVGLIESSESGEEWYLTYMKNCIGSETAAAQRGREYRERLTDEQRKKERERARIGMAKIRAQRKQKDDVTECYKHVTNVEKEKEKEKDINVQKDIKKQHQKDVDDLFESLWKLYVRKEGKSAVNKKAKEEIFNVGYERMKSCIEHYAELKKDSEKQFLLMGSTFFNGRYKDYLVNEEPKKELIPEGEEEEELSDEEWLEQMRNMED